MLTMIHLASDSVSLTQAYEVNLNRVFIPTSLRFASLPRHLQGPLSNLRSGVGSWEDTALSSWTTLQGVSAHFKSTLTTQAPGWRRYVCDLKRGRAHVWVPVTVNLEDTVHHRESWVIR